jgi:hypothetical protein
VSVWDTEVVIGVRGTGMLSYRCWIPRLLIE